MNAGAVHSVPTVKPASEHGRMIEFASGQSLCPIILPTSRAPELLWQPPSMIGVHIAVGQDKNIFLLIDILSTNSFPLFGHEKAGTLPPYLIQ